MSTLALTPSVTYGRSRVVADRRIAMVTAKLRVLLVAGGFVFVAAMALLRIVFFGVHGTGSETLNLQAALLPPRGEIVDRNGMALALNYPSRALWYNPDALGENGTPLVHSPRAIAHALKAIFPDMDEARIMHRLATGQRGYLRHHVLPEEANRVNDLGELALELPQENKRFYPQGSMAAHVLGYVGADDNGNAGMEEVLDKRLSDPATRGTPVALSLDIRVQGALEDELSRTMHAVDAKGAAGIVLDVETGEVLALASLPEFDPNHVRTSDIRVTPAQAAEGDVPASFNRVTNQVYELGSTFKPITVASAIDAGVVRDFAKRYDATPLHVGRFTISDIHKMGASLNIPETLIHSSNTVTARLADQLGGDRLRRTMIALGMNERPYIELPAKGMPIWPGKDWPRLRTMTVGFGHGIAVTPLHLASAYAALVNGGIWRPATLLKIAPGYAPRGRRVFQESTSSRMRQLLRMITAYGTGRSADAPGYRVGGKTGSAEKPGKHGYRKTALVSTFAAAFPMDNPRYVVVAMLDEPKGTRASSYQRTAAWNAAPIVGRLVPRIGPLLGVRPDMTHDIDISDLRPMVPEAEGHMGPEGE